MFVIGLVTCACIHEACKRRGVSSSAAVTLGVEALLLIAFVIAGGRYMGRAGVQSGLSPHRFYLLLALACSAMGIQNATLTRVGSLTVRTTHVTGTLAQFAESWSRYMFWFYDKTRGPGTYRFREALRLSAHHEDFKDAALTAALWFGFLAGGLCGVWLLYRWNLNALFLPVAILAAFTITDLIRPISIGKAVRSRT
jgi:uncharacterized membrane protein YoaK (UPF0700 family)